MLTSDEINKAEKYYELLSSSHANIICVLILDWRELKKENELLKSKLATAVQYLKEGKIKFAKDTTNSLVDDFLKDYEQRKGEDETQRLISKVRS